MNITTITLLDFGIDELGQEFAKLEFKPLIGESTEVTVVALRKGDTLTTDAPFVEPLEGASAFEHAIRE